MNKEEQKYLIALTHIPKFGPQRIRLLKKYFLSYQAVFEAGFSELKKTRLDENYINDFLAARTRIKPDEIIHKMLQENIGILTDEDELYPKLLREIHQAPVALYFKGNIGIIGTYGIAVVGTRKYSPYGQRVTEKLTADLAKNQITVTSGLALGIDTIAHNACLEAKGITIAVLGTGLNKQCIYPAANRYLAEKIIAHNGLIISEFPLDTPPLKQNFPQRNRIISGLSLGTLVIEAAEKSGALITARFACEQNREVFSVPGNIFSASSTGPNKLIQEGAKLVTGANDILESLNLKNITEYIENKKIIGETKEEKLILEFLSQEPLHINEIIKKTRLNTSLINSTLSLMEIKGMIRNMGNMSYVLAR